VARFLILIFLINSAYASEWDYFSIFKNINYHEGELFFAKYTDIFLKNAKNKKIDKKRLKKLNKYIHSESSFKKYDSLVNQTIGQFTKKNPFNSCPNIIFGNENEGDALEQKWKNSLRSYCRYKLLEKVLKNKSLKKHRKFFASSLPYYLRGESLRKFKRFLKKISKNKVLQGEVLSMITDTIIEEELPLKEGIIPQLEIDKELTNYIQKNGLNKRRKQKYFLNEFKYLVGSMVENPENFKGQNPVLNFYRYNKKYLPNLKVSKSLMRMGYDHLRGKNFEKSNRIFTMAHKITEGPDKKEVLFSLLWPFIVKKDFENGSDFIRKNRMLEQFNELPPKIQFWITYCLHKNKEVILSKGLYKKIIRDFPVNYYAILSLKYLKQIIADVDGKMLFRPISMEELKSQLRPYMLSADLTKIIKRLIVWLEVGQVKFYQQELKNLLNHKAFASNDLFKSSLVFNLIGLLNHKQEYLQAFKLAFWSMENDLLKFSTPTLKAIFPFAYVKKIKNIDGSIDPLIVLSLIRQESAFNPWARSSAGARGLMQLMPGTANQVAKKRIKKRKLHKPDLNLELGINYLKKLLDKYDGNLIYTLAAYNAGERRVRDWKGKYFTSNDPLIMVESIPFKETRQYIKLIYRNIFFYRYLTNDSEISMSVEDSFKISSN
jgi:soluble lytic murein transglycosylase